jgi:hypothetical protein
VVDRKTDLKELPMERPGTRDTKARWVEYALHLEDQLANLDQVEKTQVPDGRLEALASEVKALRDQRDQLLRTNHALRSRKE